MEVIEGRRIGNDWHDESLRDLRAIAEREYANAHDTEMRRQAHRLALEIQEVLRRHVPTTAIDVAHGRPIASIDSLRFTVDFDANDVAYLRVEVTCPDCQVVGWSTVIVNREALARTLVRPVLSQHICNEEF